ncbi:MAG: hypothetical protein IPK32_24340 [Verrucomicrobiaceae bacterium]|nr:hypothetical protein [Verrucomicrobiaceae bacterium]
MPNIQIIDHWQHHDISMEDFGFEVLVAGEVREINFFEHSAQMQIKEDGEIRAFINECLFGTSLQNKLLPQSIFRQRNVDGIIRHTQNEKE